MYKLGRMGHAISLDEEKKKHTTAKHIITDWLIEFSTEIKKISEFEF